MSSIGLVLPTAKSFGSHDAYIGVDSGSFLLLENDITPVCCVGDFDSCSSDALIELKSLLPNLKISPCEKDDTDTLLAIRKALELGYTSIVIYGGIQGRFDHTLANYHLLLKYDDIILIDESNKVMKLKKGIHYLKNEGYTYLSFFVCKDTHLTLRGVKYPLEHHCLTAYDNLGVSNEFLSMEIYVQCDHDIICIMSNDI